MNDCVCVGKHIPKAMTTHRYSFLDEEDTTQTSPHVYLCPTTLDNVVKLEAIYREHNGRPPWAILKGYSEYTRYVVEKGRELRRTRTNTLFNFNR